MLPAFSYSMKIKHQVKVCLNMVRFTKLSKFFADIKKFNIN